MKTANNGSIELAFDVEGDGPPLLLIAGTGADRNLWGHVRPELNRRFRTIAFDNRDAGRSTKVSSSYSAVDLAEDALAVLRTAGVERAHVVGHSMGGVVAQELAIGWPERVSSLTLTNTWTRADHYVRAVCKLAHDLTETIADDELRSRAIYFLALGPAFLTQVALSEVVGAVLSASPTQPQASLKRQWALDLELDTLDRLGRISAPTHVLWSPADRFLPEVHARQLVQGIPDARETRFDDGIGHCPMIESPDAFVDAVTSFIARR